MISHIFPTTLNDCVAKIAKAQILEIWKYNKIFIADYFIVDLITLQHCLSLFCFAQQEQEHAKTGMPEYMHRLPKISHMVMQIVTNVSETFYKIQK